MSLLTTAPPSFGQILDAFLHGFLPEFAVAATLMAIVWLACTIVALAGLCLGNMVFVGVRALARSFIRWFRTRRDDKDTGDEDGVTTKVVDLDRFRRLRRSRAGRNGGAA